MLCMNFEPGIWPGGSSMDGHFADKININNLCIEFIGNFGNL